MTRAEELQKTWRTKTGQLWTLDRHTLLIADSTEARSHHRALNGRTIDMVWTDPPYGVNYEAEAGTIANDHLDNHALENFLREVLTHTHNHTKPGGTWYVAAPSGNRFRPFANVLDDLGIWRHTIAWIKDSLVLGRADYHYRDESILYGYRPHTPNQLADPPTDDTINWLLDDTIPRQDKITYGWKEGAAHHFIDDRTQDTVWEIPRPRASQDHPTMKPLELVTRSIMNSSRPTDLIYDPFLGSGTTLRAAHTTNRIGVGIELDPGYAATILQWFADQGITPKLEQ